MIEASRTIRIFLQLLAVNWMNWDIFRSFFQSVPHFQWAAVNIAAINNVFKNITEEMFITLKYSPFSLLRNISSKLINVLIPRILQEQIKTSSKRGKADDDGLNAVHSIPIRFQKLAVHQKSAAGSTSDHVRDFHLNFQHFSNQLLEQCCPSDFSLTIDSVTWLLFVNPCWFHLIIYCNDAPGKWCAAHHLPGAHTVCVLL